MCVEPSAADLTARLAFPSVEASCGGLGEVMRFAGLDRDAGPFATTRPYWEPIERRREALPWRCDAERNASINVCESERNSTWGLGYDISPFWQAPRKAPSPAPSPPFEHTWNAQEIFDAWTQVSGLLFSENLQDGWTHLGGDCTNQVQHKRSPLLAIDSTTGVSRSDFLYVTVESYPQNWGNASPMRLTARVVTADGAQRYPAPWAERDRIGKFNDPDESSWVNNTFELVDPGGDLYIDVYVSEVGNCFGIRSITVSSEP